MGIKKECVDRIIGKSEADPLDLVNIITSFSPEPRREGASWKTACPLCGAEHALVITPGRRVFKCFNCNELSGKRPLDYLMKGQKMSFPDAIEWLANYYGILIDYDEPARKKTSGKAKSQKDSFCRRMLRDSGLTEQDVTATVIDISDSQTKYRQRTFTPGTVNGRGEIDETGDDAVIHYYDLDGRPVRYVNPKDKSATERTYYRVRFQYPSEHLDSNKREMKYKSPPGAPTFIYIPQKIRTLYQTRKEIPTLYIQEGEKKAEKACKHGLDSVAISGIQNLGYKGTLPEEIVKLVEVCHVRSVIFLLDSDCFDLTSHIKVDDPIDRRPKNFFYAVKNYKEYFNRLKNRELYVELYFGYVLKNEAGDKGVDDLLTNSLKGHEDDLKKDIETAINEKQMTGRYVQLHKITTATDGKIMEIWKLQSSQEFCQRYFEQLKNLPEFTFGRRKYRFTADGQLESAQPIEGDEQFWREQHKKNQESSEYSFCYTGCKNFLEHRGFYRYRRPDGEFDFIHVEKPVIRTVRYWEIGDFVKEFARDCLQKGILEMLLKGGNQYFGQAMLTMLTFFDPNFPLPNRGVQRFYFRDSWWHITADTISVQEYPQLHEIIWDEQRKTGYNPPQLRPLIDVMKDGDGRYSYTITPTGAKCHFLKFLENASNFTWRKDSPEPSELDENAQHLVSKLAAFGYLVSTAKDKSISKAVIGMDGKQSEVGVSNGRSGKSLLGEAVKVVTTSRYYNGKELNSRNGNQFIWDGVNEKTRVVFIDDAMKDFDFEMLFGLITGDWPVNPKGDTHYIIPFSLSPKIYLTTNHAIGGTGSSFIDRQWPIAFSDYYNDTHKPVDDFGLLFFDEWDAEQWDLFWNLVAQSVQIYFRFGYVPAPGERLEMRKLRQDIGEEFLLWADEYFSDENRLNTELKRKELYDTFLAFVGSEKKKFYTATSFKAKMKAYCKFKDYFFNPDMYNPVTGECRRTDKDGRIVYDNKHGGVEYFTIGTPDYYETHTMPDMFSEIEDMTADDLPE